MTLKSLDPKGLLTLSVLYNGFNVFILHTHSRCVRLTTLPPSCAVVMKFGNLNFLEPSGPHQASNGTALPFISKSWSRGWSRRKVWHANGRRPSHTSIVCLKLHRAPDPALYPTDPLLPLCYWSEVQTPELFGLKNGALAVYFSPRRLIPRFSRNVSVTDALRWYFLACFVRILRFWSEDYPDLHGL
jgi:hypothetical protein